MSTKLALILTGAWTVLVMIACGGGIWFVTTQVPRHQQERRASALGSATATVAVVGYAAIMLPWAAAIGKKRRQQREAEAQAKRSPRKEK